MRTIKFRAWNKVQEKMFTVEGLGFVYEPPAILKLDHEMPNIKVTDYWLHDEDFELMQYTGLKDKNGKEIYEGDIVKKGTYKDNGFSNEGFENLCIIRFFRGSFVLNEVEDGEEFGPEESFVSSSFYGDWQASKWETAYEVIGNIYENKELLK